MGDLAAAERPGGDRLVPVVGSAVVEGFADDGGLQEAEPAAGRRRVFLDGGQEPGAQVGMFRLDAPGHPARSRADRRPRWRSRARPAAARSASDQPGSQHARTGTGAPATDERRAPAEQGPGQPAERQAAPEPRLPESARDLFQCLPQFCCSCRHGLRAGQAGRLEPPRQPGFDDQDADRRQDQPAPELLAIFQLRVLHLPELLVVDGSGLRRLASRQPNCSSVSTCKGAVLLSSGSRFTANDRGPAGRVDRVDAGLVRLGEGRACPARA